MADLFLRPAGEDMQLMPPQEAPEAPAELTETRHRRRRRWEKVGPSRLPDRNGELVVLR